MLYSTQKRKFYKLGNDLDILKVYEEAKYVEEVKTVLPGFWGECGGGR